MKAVLKYMMQAAGLGLPIADTSALPKFTIGNGNLPGTCMCAEEWLHTCHDQCSHTPHTYPSLAS